MLTRKEMKENAKISLKKHYLIFVVSCIVLIFLTTGFDFTSLNSYTNYNSEGISDSNISSDSSDIASEELSQGVLVKTPGFSDVILDLLRGNEGGGRDLANQITQNEIDQAKEHPVLGRSRGIFSSLLNKAFSGSIIVTIVGAISNVTGHTSAVLLCLIILAFIIYFLFWFFVKNTIFVIINRIFLEGQTYEHVSSQKFLFLMHVRKWRKAAWAMFVTFVYQFFWWLTIVGGAIKMYSYYLVPYILAENPNLTASEAITLSRKMMNGHKWECFVFNLSFIGWSILSIFTFNLSAIFFSNLYKRAAYSQYYMQLRRIAKNNNIENSNLLNDTYLFEKAEDSAIQAAYGDVISIIDNPVPTQPLKGLKGFLANVFGIILTYSKNDKAYEESMAEEVRISALKDCVTGTTYPNRLFPIPEVEKQKRVETINYMRHYSITSLIFLFFIFAFIGWTWEVSLHLISDGVFVNRGVLHGPWLPIYGTGGTMILIVLNKFRKHPIVEFSCALVLCGCVEYFTSYYLEMAHNGQKWWDYSGYFLNLNGRICAEGLLVFGLGGMAIVYVLAPVIDNYLRKIPLKIAAPICAALLCIYMVDNVYSSKHPNSGKGITDYANSSTGQIIDSVRPALAETGQVISGKGVSFLL